MINQQTANAEPSRTCQWCGFIHASAGKCPMVKAFEYHENGTVKRVEFFSPADYALPVIYGPNGSRPDYDWKPYPIT